jgi:hypothetical protein
MTTTALRVQVRLDTLASLADTGLYLANLACLEQALTTAAPAALVAEEDTIRARVPDQVAERVWLRTQLDESPTAPYRRAFWASVVQDRPGLRHLQVA